ncbi:hypothetical protein [Daejeonella sp.]|uniref:hypothetical protein n=1 Tax=Daejeonella sp. TaxID=2805397 RepID=UPI0030C1AE86
MNNSNNPVRSERYSSRYTRGFLEMLVNDGQAETDQYVEQFYASKNYQCRLEAIKYLIGISGKYSFPESIFIDALKDFCSQVKVYVLQNYDFQKADDPEIQNCLADIAKDDEKIQVRALAIDKLSGLDTAEHHDLFFSTSLLKSSKESASGLRGLYKLDKEKAYQMAKFRADGSSGKLDLAIAEIFQAEGNIDDLHFFKARLKARTKFNKIDLVRIYLKMLGELEIEALIKTQIVYICEDISLTGNTELVQRLIMELYQFISEHKVFMSQHQDLQRFVDKIIDLLLEKDYLKAKKANPFGNSLI